MLLFAQDRNSSDLVKLRNVNHTLDSQVKDGNVGFSSLPRPRVPIFKNQQDGTRYNNTTLN